MSRWLVHLMFLLGTIFLCLIASVRAQVTTYINESELP